MKNTRHNFHISQSPKYFKTHFSSMDMCFIPWVGRGPPPTSSNQSITIFNQHTSHKHKAEMKTSFLDYYKLILEKVSFDESLLMKEYEKALTRINEYEQRELEAWIQSNKLLGNAQLKVQPLRFNKK